MSTASSSRAAVVVLTVCPTSVTLDRRGHLYSSCQVGQTCAVWRGSDRCETAVEAPARHGLRLYSIRNVRHQSTNDRPSACRAAMTRCADDPTPSRHLSQFSLSPSTISRVPIRISSPALGPALVCAALPRCQPSLFPHLDLLLPIRVSPSKPTLTHLQPSPPLTPILMSTVS